MVILEEITPFIVLQTAAKVGKKQIFKQVLNLAYGISASLMNNMVGQLG